MPIEMPPFPKIYKQREGVNKFFYDKMCEVVAVINALSAGNTSNITVSVKDDNGDGVEGAKVTLTAGGINYSSNDTGSAGGSSIKDVPYGVYSVNVTVPSGYTALATYNDLTVNSESTTLNVTVNKNVTKETYGFTSYADAQGETEWGQGTVETTGVTSGNYTQVEVKTNTPDASFVGQKFYIISSAETDGTIYELFTDAGTTSAGIYVSITTTT